MTTTTKGGGGVNTLKLSGVDVIKIFGGNLDFPKIKKLNKVCSDD